MAVATVVNDADLIRVRSFRPNGAPRVVGLPVGERAAPWNVRAVAIAAAADAFTLRARDAATNDRLTKAERAERIGGMAAPFYAKLNEAGGEIVAGAARLRERMNSAAFTTPYEKAPGHKPFFDLAVIAAFNDLQPTQRSSRLAVLTEEPWTDLDLLDALHRVPKIVSRLSDREHSRLRVAAFRALRADEAAALDLEAAQFGLALSSLRAAVEVVSETVGSLADLAKAAPGALAASDVQPVRWEEA